MIQAHSAAHPARFGRTTHGFALRPQRVRRAGFSCFRSLDRVGVADIGCGPGAGWDFAGPSAAASGAAIIGYRDVGGAGLDLRVAATTAVAVVIEFGGRELIVDDAGGQQASGGFVVGPHGGHAYS